METRTKPWTASNPPPPAENWTDEEKKNCVAAANAALERGESEQDAIFACIGAAGKSAEEDGIMKKDLILVQASRILSHDQIQEAVWDHVYGAMDMEAVEYPGMPGDDRITFTVRDIYDTYADVAGSDNSIWRIPFTIMDDKVEFGTPMEMELRPKGESVEAKSQGGAEGPDESEVAANKARMDTALEDGKVSGVAGARSTFKIYEKGGVTRWIAVTGTAFKDHEKEIISRGAIDYSIGYSDITQQRGELNLYHMPHVVLGSCDFQFRVDKVLLEGGLWYDNPYARATRNWVDNIAGRGKQSKAGCSVEFVYDPEDRKKGVYEKVIIYNRAVLKLEHAANPYTWIGSPDNIRRKEMSSMEDLKDILGDELAESAVSDAKDTSASAEGTGAEFKGDAVAPDGDVAEEPVDAKKTDADGEEPVLEDEKGDDGGDEVPADDAGEVPAEEPVLKEIVFSDQTVADLASAVSEALGVDKMVKSVEALADVVKILAQKDEDRLANKLAHVPSGIIRDRERGIEPVPADKVVNPKQEDKSEEEEVAAAREDVFKTFVK